MTQYLTTIGLEIHAELKTRTKMFCDSKNDPDEIQPNINICPVCMGHPGTLPVINKEAVKHVLKVGIALGGEIANYTEFDRKNYFYPDIPKGYQISQYKFPLVKGGELNGVKITRVHLEEDTGKSTHEKGEYSLIDFNRAGVPLMELVTEPVIHSTEDAVNFARELQLVLQYLGVAEANMEKGEMRVEANVSVSRETETADSRRKKLGTKVEVKNLNSFRSVERAIGYEVKRHIALLEKGEKVVQETRGWDEHKEITFSQRQKEDSHDYRYFPDPDLPKLIISELPEFTKEELRKEIPLLPNEKRIFYKKEFDLKEGDTEIYIMRPKLGNFFEEVVKLLKGKSSIALASNYIVSDLVGIIKKENNNNSGEIIFSPLEFSKLIGLVASGKISSRGAKDILVLMHACGGDPETIAKDKNLLQNSDENLLKLTAEKLINLHSKVVEDYKNGKESALQFLVGQMMKETKGSANPVVAKQIFEELLKK